MLRSELNSAWRDDMTTVDRARFGAETTTSEVLSGIDLHGRVALVTGASGGLGAETARALAERGAAVTLAARDMAKAEGVAESIRASTGNDGIDLARLELSSPDSVRACAKGWLEGHGELHLLINNAGVMACPLDRTREGWEMQFATNHLGHFLLTALLVPALRAGAPSRIVNLSSAGHRLAGVDFDDIHFERRDYDKWVAYGQSKTANVLFTRELDRRLKQDGVRAYAVHPGVIMTELARHLTPDDIKDLLDRAPGEGGLVFKSVETGAATEVYAATAPELEGQGGLYLEDCRIGGLAESEAASLGYAPHAVDPEAVARLWQVSEQLLGERFDL
jgi:NAD(P)-dependent dehydrogenase (short-subunit alcohol dehydrogenase family)